MSKADASVGASRSATGTITTRARFIFSLAMLVVGTLQLTGCGTLNTRSEFDIPDPIRIELPEKFRAEMDVKGNMVINGNLTMRVSGGTVKYEGTYISGEMLEMVQLNHTTGDWLLAVFGQPTDRSTLDDGSEIWRWVYRPVEQEQIPQVVQVTALGVGESNKPKMSAVYQIAFVQLRGNKVVAKGRG